MAEKIYRLNEGGLLLHVREDIPTQWRGSAFVCQKRYTDSMEGVCFCMAEKINRLNKGGCFCMSEKIYRLNGGDLLLYSGADVPTQ